MLNARYAVLCHATEHRRATQKQLQRIDGTLPFLTAPIAMGFILP